MLPGLLAPVREKERPSHGPHRLALAAAAAPADAAAAVSPRSPSAGRLAASAAGLASPRARALPAYRSLLASPRRRKAQRLPHVQASAEQPTLSYTSLEPLRRLNELHKGKHSTVHSYLDTRSGQLVVVKTYYKRTMQKRHYRNVRREVAISRLLSMQRFSGVVQLLGTFDDESHMYLVQESCAGGDLYKRLVRAGGVLGEAEVARDVVVPLLLTLTFLHASHIVHRDIKPENIFYTADGGLRLGDFGLSIDAQKERPTSRVGTLDYMAPEVVGMPSPDDIQRRGLKPHQIGHYGCKVDVWAVGILAYELLCGRPPFEVEDQKLTEQHIKFSEVNFPPHISPLCRSFIQQALTKRPESRPSAAQLFQHPWVRQHYQALAAEHQHPVAVAGAAAAGAAFTPELRRTVSQPPSPSKSMPDGAAAAAGRVAGAGAVTPAAVASALAPFLPLSQAKMAHKVRLLSPGRPPSSGRALGARRRRVSDPLARVQVPPAEEDAAAAEEDAAAAAEAAAPAACGDVPPATPPPAAAPAAVSEGAGAVAAGSDLQDGASSGAAFETPGTPGIQVTPLPRQRPVVVPRPLGRSPFLMPQLATPGNGGAAAGEAQHVQQQQQQPGVGPAAGLGGRKAAGPGRSRFAAAAAEAENDEAAAVAVLCESGELAAALSSPSALQARSSSLTSLAKREGSSNSLTPAARASSFTSFGGGSSGNLQLAARASSFTSFGGSNNNLANIGPLMARAGSKAELEACEAGPGATDAAADRLQRLHL